MTPPTHSSRSLAGRIITALLLGAVAAPGEEGVITSCAADIPELEATLNAANYFSIAYPSPAEALVVGAPIAVISASPEHLQDLLKHPEAVAAFTAPGGWILLNGLTPTGLSDFDTLVGFHHILRPFRSEMVALAPQLPRIARGLSQEDVGMRSTTNPWVGDFIVASDAYGWVVDTDNFAPFATLPDFTWFHHPDTNNDHNPANLIDGFLNNNNWKRAFALYPTRSRMDFTMTLPRSMAISAIDVTNSFIYPGITHLSFTFDGDAKSKLLLATQPSGSAHLALEKPVTVTTITVTVVDWIDTGRDVIGIDEISLTPQRDVSYPQLVQPVTNIGALVTYPRGRGGILLCELAFPAQEQDFSNQQRRRNVLGTLMRNAGSSQGRPPAEVALIPPPPTIAIGTPCELGHQAVPEQSGVAWIDPHLSQPSWPSGTVSLGGIGFSLGSKPEVVLRHAVDPPAIIPISLQARSLVFLHLADTTLADGQQVAHYTVVYQDGRRAEIPIFTSSDVATYRQVAPRPVLRAQTAWIGRNADPSQVGFSVIYSRQWDNPTPHAPIDHVEVACDDAGSTFAVLGVTALPTESASDHP